MALHPSLVTAPPRPGTAAVIGPLVLSAILAAAPPSSAGAGVVVVANRTPGEVTLVLWAETSPATSRRLAPGQVAPIAAETELGVALGSGRSARRYRLSPGGVYCVLRRDEQIDLQTILPPRRGARGTENQPERPERTEGPHRPLSGAPPDDLIAPPAEQPGVISVKLLVDDEEPAVRAAWEKRLRERLAAASAVLERHTPVRFEAVAFGTWETTDAQFDFVRTLGEFERRVDPAPARLAIGFSSQYRVVSGRTHMGGTRGPLSTHILIREWSQHVGWNERVEILVHELGHFLGAAHSPEPDSVMRPMLGDRQSNARQFAIRFDPLNTLIVYRMGEQLRRQPRLLPADLPSDVVADLAAAYEALSRAAPGDPSARQQANWLRRAAQSRNPLDRPLPMPSLGPVQPLVR